MRQVNERHERTRTIWGLSLEIHKELLGKIMATKPDVLLDLRNASKVVASL